VLLDIVNVSVILSLNISVLLMSKTNDIFHNILLNVTQNGNIAAKLNFC